MCSGSHGNEQQFVSVFVNVTDAPGDSSNGTDVNPSDTPGLPIDPNGRRAQFLLLLDGQEGSICVCR